MSLCRERSNGATEHPGSAYRFPLSAYLTGVSQVDRLVSVPGIGGGVPIVDLPIMD
ncbi:MAG TPA: hypothetical protein PKA12_18145 [Saprospiraceae bacterium]|nr:hypothetical protein [Saprospiraceae bacterium]